MHGEEDSFSHSLSANNSKKSSAKAKKPKADKDINDVIKDALMNYLLNSNGKLYKEDCAKAATATLQEFMQAFILIGYDFQGTPIRIVHCHNGQEADALTCAMQKFMISNSRMFDGD